MSYSINISGHFQSEDASEREQRVVDLTARFLEDLKRHVGDDGVASAAFSGQHLGYVNFGNADTVPANTTPPDAPPVGSVPRSSDPNAPTQAAGPSETNDDPEPGESFPGELDGETQPESTGPKPDGDGFQS